MDFYFSYGERSLEAVYLDSKQASSAYDLVRFFVLAKILERCYSTFTLLDFIDEIPMYQVRLQVRPGITGWAQVNGLRGDTDISERIRYDIWYIENWSVSLDLKIILRTVFGGMINSEKLK